MNLNVLKYKINKRIIKILGDKSYNSYSEALKDCLSNGYENDAIMKLTKEKAILYRKNIANGQLPHITNLNIFPLVSLINELSQDKTSLHIIDFGGADGGHYLLARQLLRKEISLNWQVVETAEMVKAMQAFKTNELSHSDNLDATIELTDKIDILYTSGTLQYTPNPYDFLEKMLNSGAEYLVFNRQSLNFNDHDLITIQRSLLSWHGSEDITTKFTDCAIRYPHTNMSLKKFEAMIQEKYTILYTYDDASGVKKVQNETIVGKSYVLKRL